MIDNPTQDFFIVVDEFTQEEYLLYSPGLERTAAEMNGIDLIFNLITFNGKCYETYGPIGCYDNINGDDIFFFATEKNYRVEEDEDVVEDVEKDPFPYSLLLSAMGQPMLVNDGNYLALNRSMDIIEDVDIEKLKSAFQFEEAMGVYRFKDGEWSGFPHYAVSYYDTKIAKFSLQAQTDDGYNEMHEALEKAGISLPTISDIRVNLGVLFVIENILNKEISVGLYNSLFEDEEDLDEISNEELDNLNEAMDEMMGLVNERKKIDFDDVSERHQVDIETLKNMVQHLYDKLGIKNPNQ